MAHVFIGIGSSLNKAENICSGIASLKEKFGLLSVSPVYESEAVGFNGGNFYNLVVEFNTDLSVQALLSCLKELEVKHGRPENAIKYAPRTLDLDLLLYDRLVDESINIPRAEITENAFVLKPLSELAPNMKHPLLNQSYKNLWDCYPQEKQKLWEITLQY